MVKRKANTDADSLSTTVKDENAAGTSRIYIALFSESNNIQRLSTYSDIEEDDFTCSFCGLPADLCTCVVITPGGMRCPLCGGPWGSCSCLSDIYGPGNGNENSGDDDYNGPSGGGNGTGGGNSGNHNGSEGNGSGNGNIVITSPNQKPVKDITQAASDAVDEVLKDHNNNRKTAYCNEGVRNAFYNIAVR